MTGPTYPTYPIYTSNRFPVPAQPRVQNRTTQTQAAPLVVRRTGYPDQAPAPAARGTGEAQAPAGRGPVSIIKTGRLVQGLPEFGAQAQSQAPAPAPLPYTYAPAPGAPAAIGKVSTNQSPTQAQAPHHVPVQELPKFGARAQLQVLPKTTAQNTYRGQHQPRTPVPAPAPPTNPAARWTGVSTTQFEAQPLARNQNHRTVTVQVLPSHKAPVKELKRFDKEDPTPAPDKLLSKLSDAAQDRVLAQSQNLTQAQPQVQLQIPVTVLPQNLNQRGASIEERQKSSDFLLFDTLVAIRDIDSDFLFFDTLVAIRDIDKFVDFAVKGIEEGKLSKDYKDNKHILNIRLVDRYLSTYNLKIEDLNIVAKRFSADARKLYPDDDYWYVDLFKEAIYKDLINSSNISFSRDIKSIKDNDAFVDLAKCAIKKNILSEDDKLKVNKELVNRYLLKHGDDPKKIAEQFSADARKLYPDDDSGYVALLKQASGSGLINSQNISCLSKDDKLTVNEELVDRYLRHRDPKIVAKRFIADARKLYQDDDSGYVDLLKQASGRLINSQNISCLSKDDKLTVNEELVDRYLLKYQYEDLKIEDLEQFITDARKLYQNDDAGYVDLLTQAIGSGLINSQNISCLDFTSINNIDAFVDLAKCAIKKNILSKENKNDLNIGLFGRYLLKYQYEDPKIVAKQFSADARKLYPDDDSGYRALLSLFDEATKPPVPTTHLSLSPSSSSYSLVPSSSSYSLVPSDDAQPPAPDTASTEEGLSICHSSSSLDSSRSSLVSATVPGVAKKFTSTSLLQDCLTEDGLEKVKLKFGKNLKCSGGEVDIWYLFRHYSRNNELNSLKRFLDPDFINHLKSEATKIDNQYKLLTDLNNYISQLDPSGLKGCLTEKAFKACNGILKPGYTPPQPARLYNPGILKPRCYAKSQPPRLDNPSDLVHKLLESNDFECLHNNYKPEVIDSIIKPILAEFSPSDTMLKNTKEDMMELYHFMSDGNQLSDNSLELGESAKRFIPQLIAYQKKLSNPSKSLPPQTTRFSISLPPNTVIEPTTSAWALFGGLFSDFGR